MREPLDPATISAAALAVILLAILLGLLLRDQIRKHNRSLPAPAPVEQPATIPQRATPPKPRPAKPPKTVLVWRSIYSDARIRRMHWGEQQEANHGRA